jgi:hypothetical protein
LIELQIQRRRYHAAIQLSNRCRLEITGVLEALMTRTWLASLAEAGGIKQEYMVQ